MPSTVHDSVFTQDIIHARLSNVHITLNKKFRWRKWHQRTLSSTNSQPAVKVVNNSVKKRKFDITYPSSGGDAGDHCIVGAGVEITRVEVKGIRELSDSLNLGLQ